MKLSCDGLPPGHTHSRGALNTGREPPPLPSGRRAALSREPSGSSRPAVRSSRDAPSCGSRPLRARRPDLVPRSSPHNRDTHSRIQTQRAAPFTSRSRLSPKLPAFYPRCIWRISTSAVSPSPHMSSKRASTLPVAPGVNTPTEAPQPSASAWTSRPRRCPRKSGRSCRNESVIRSKSSPPTHDPNIAIGRWLAGECVTRSKRPWWIRQDGEGPDPPGRLRESELKGSGRADRPSVFASLPTPTFDSADMLPACP